jgi:hypothetical protein
MFKVIDNSALYAWEQALEDHSPAGMTLGEARTILAARPTPDVSAAATDLARLIEAMERSGCRPTDRPNSSTWCQLLPSSIRPPIV